MCCIKSTYSIKRWRPGPRDKASLSTWSILQQDSQSYPREKQRIFKLSEVTFRKCQESKDLGTESVHFAVSALSKRHSRFLRRFHCQLQWPTPRPPAKHRPWQRWVRRRPSPWEGLMVWQQLLSHICPWCGLFHQSINSDKRKHM